MGSTESAALVIGGGIAGIAAALGIAENGIAVSILEREEDIGGHGARLCCKATDVCRQCGACIVADKIEQVRANPNVSILTRAELVNLSGAAGAFDATIVRDNSNELRMRISAVVVATGFAPFDARQKPELGYRTCANVLTGLELEEQIRRTGSIVRPSDGCRPANIAFVQCVGSRDPHIGNDYCSRVCCKYALRMASMLQTRIPDLDVTVFYMDVQVGGKGFYDFYQSCRNTMRFVRAIPVGVLENGSGSVDVQYEDTARGRVVKEPFDMVVLSVGMVPAADAGTLAAMLGIGTNGSRFFAGRDATETNLTNVDGIVLAGACQGPKDIEGSIAHAQAAALRVVAQRGVA
jgi:heterodisulfide reductase subunit A